MNRTDDRKTDHATEKCVAIGRIACAARHDFTQQYTDECPNIP